VNASPDSLSSRWNGTTMNTSTKARGYPNADGSGVARSRMRSAYASLACALVLLLCFRIAHAVPQNITEGEIALLPPYCSDAHTFHGWGGTPDSWSPNAPKWIALMGKGFFSIHHYCWALIDLMRIEKPGVPDVIKLGTRRGVISDLNFVIDNSPRDFVLLPEIYTKMGDVQIDLKNYQQADMAFAKARSIKPDYWPAYSHWAYFLLNAGKKAEAKALVAEGLAYDPRSTTLNKLFRQLGGDPRTVVPKKATQNASKSDADVASGTTSEPATPPQ
jgi:tetratricopeptide (TPR) repeat protein